MNECRRRALGDDAELRGGRAPASSTFRDTLVRSRVARVHQTDRQRRTARVDRYSTRLRRHTLTCHACTRKPVAATN